MKNYFFIYALIILSSILFSSCSVTKKTETTQTIPIIINTEQVRTAKMDGRQDVNFPFRTQINPQKNVTFVFSALGYYPYTLNIPQGSDQSYFEIIFTENPKEMAKLRSYENDPTIRAGEATNMVSRDNPGATALERTILRWYFDSDPRGARIYWRVISSVPDQVKNTNETYLMTTPFEETRSFNILGLTYENSRDVTIEIKVSKKGYEDQVKRFNARQAIDQQEISGFFEMVEKSE